jgi:hypothetical protein
LRSSNKSPPGQLPPAEQLDLLTRFAPTLHFDALERWRPTAADSYLNNSIFFDGSGHPVPISPPALAAMRDGFGELKSQLNPLEREPDSHTHQRSKEILAAYGGQQDLRGGGTCYGRVVPTDDGDLFLQYWLFYPDNPCVLPPGRHDGDWEMVQLRVRQAGGGFESTHATVAGHGKPRTQEFRSDGGGVDVFVAVDSHAAYFKSGAHPELPLSDICDPDEDDGGVVPAVTLFPTDLDPDWTLWSGRWGMNPGTGVWLAKLLRLRRTPSLMSRLKVGAGESPASPGRQGSSWEYPGRFELRGKFSATSRIQRLAHFIGKLTWPRLLPAVRVERVASETYAITAKPAGYFARRVTMVAVAFEDRLPDGTRRGVELHSVRTGQPSGPWKIPAEGELYWRAAGYNRLRQRSEPMPAKKPVNPAWPIKVKGTSSDDQGARRVFEGALTGHLRRRGATTAAAMHGALGWFWLRLSTAEIAATIDASRRDGLVAPLEQSKDAAGKPVVEDEWGLTDQGRSHERTRALSLRDSIVAIRGVGTPVVSTSEKWVKRVAAVLATVIPTLALSTSVSVLTGVVAAGIIIALTANTGLRGETELRQAAEHWPRLRTCRPNTHAWQTTIWRPWERVPIALVATAYLVAAALALRLSDTWKFNVWIALGIGIAAAAIAWWRLGKVWRHWLSLNEAFREERDDLRNRRRREPGNPCVWGHQCAATEGGRETSCPTFKPGATPATPRVPPIL